MKKMDKEEKNKMANPSPKEISAVQIQYFTPRELAKMWRMHHRTLELWRRQNRGPAFLRRGGRILYPISEVKKYERSQLNASRETR